MIENVVNIFRKIDWFTITSNQSKNGFILKLINFIDHDSM